MTTIALDAMGSDDYPDVDMRGAVLAAQEYDLDLIVVGDEKQLRPLLDSLSPGNLPIRIVHAPDMLTMNDKNDDLVRKARHKDSQNSMAVAIDLVKSGEADAFVTAGNTGAAMVTSLFRLGRLKGINRPALAPVFPTATGSCVVMDVGANPDCKPRNLVEFAIMGSVYAEKVRGATNPKVGIVSNGEEAGKGSNLVRETYPLLEKSGVNFVGNVEGKGVIGGEVDVAVTDGFTGNVMLKTSEAVAKLLVNKIKEAIMAGGILAKIGGLLVKPALGVVKEMLDPSDVGAAPLLGVDGLVFIGHGSSNANAIKNAIRVAKEAVEADVLNSMRAAIEKK
ncbi:MAG: phosphate acyltransferase PlsX [Anaerolineae bacterium]|nr:phosphate acyltransferase PlsX [Anaerolineae bacterium]MBT7070652.1 phosphate acyltransferase PlsX [Anaerolineae bacterium]MBT7326280.1 phosphate acyltransferase PlsX [Anaerolineae bacterium]